MLTHLIPLWIINQLNNITLEKLEVSNRAQMQETNELKFLVNKNSYNLNDVAAINWKKPWKKEQCCSVNFATVKATFNSDNAVIKNFVYYIQHL